MHKKPEEKYPLLYYLVDDPSRSRSFCFEKARHYNISSGATTIITEWPNHIKTCWVTSVLTAVIFFMLLMLLISSASNYKPPGPECTKTQSLFNNKTIHLVYPSHNFSQDQLEILEKVLKAFPGYTINLIVVQNKTSIEPSLNLTNASSTTEAPVKTTESLSLSTLNSIDLFRSRFETGARTLLDILLNVPERAFTISAKYLRTPTKKPLKTLGDIKSRYRKHLVYSNKTYGEIFEGTILNPVWPFFPEELKQFAVRVLQLWENGGISFDITNSTKYYSQVEEFKSKIVVTSSGIDEKEGKQVLFKSIGHEMKLYEALEPDQIILDELGIHMETKTACHIFFEKVLMVLSRNYSNYGAREVLRKVLKFFCRLELVDQGYCNQIGD